MDEQKQKIREMASGYFLCDLSTFCCWVKNLIQAEPNGSLVGELLFDQAVTPNFGAVYFLLRAANLVQLIKGGLLALWQVRALSELGEEWNDTEILCGGVEGLAEKLRERFKDDYEVCLDEFSGSNLGPEIMEWVTTSAAAKPDFRGVVEAFQEFGQLDRFQAWLFGLPAPQK